MLEIVGSLGRLMKSLEELSNLHNNTASIQKNQGNKSHRVTVALLILL